MKKIIFATVAFLSLGMLLTACSSSVAKPEPSKTVVQEVTSTSSDLEQCILLEKAVLPLWSSKSYASGQAAWQMMAWKLQPLAFMAVDPDLQDALYAAIDVSSTQSYDRMINAPDEWSEAIGAALGTCDEVIGYPFENLKAAVEQRKAG